MLNYKLDYNCEANLVVDKWFDGYMKAERDMPDNAQILLIRPYSVHPDDWYLSIVLAQLPDNDITPYVTWGCNVSFGDTRFFEGHYYKDKWEAFEDWKKR